MKTLPLPQPMAIPEEVRVALWQLARQDTHALGVLMHIMAQKLEYGQVLYATNIANTLGVSVRTVHRVIRVLCDSEYLVVAQEGDRKVYMVNARPLTPDYQTPGVH